MQLNLEKACVLAVLTASLFVFVVRIAYHEEAAPASVVTPISLQFTDTLTTDVWGIFNVDTGAVIVSKNSERVRPIASITKLFTAAIVQEDGISNAETTITAADVATEGGAGRLVAGTRMTLYELLFPLLIESSNDAAAAIERTLGNDFRARSDAVLQSSGLTQTTLSDASGLSAGNTSTVTDLAQWFAYLQKNAPHTLDISQVRIYVTADTEYHNNNPARTLASFRGGKNGFIDEAGRTFLGSFQLASGAEVGFVVLGSTDLLADITALESFANAEISSAILGQTSPIAP